jgi:cerevisin
MKTCQKTVFAFIAIALSVDLVLGTDDSKLKSWIVWLEKSMTSVELQAARELATFEFDIKQSVAFGDFNAVLVTGVNTQKMKEYLSNKRIYAIEPNQELDLCQYQPFGSDSQMQLLEKFKKQSFVSEFGAKEARKGTKCKQQKVSDRLWYLNRVSRQEVVTNFDDMSYFYNEDRDGSDVNVYVFDSGIQTTHTEFEGRAKWGYTATAIKGEPRNRDVLGHGTHVAGLVAGRTVGIAKDATVVAVKVVSKNLTASMFSVLEGIEFAVGDIQNTPTSKKGGVALLTAVGLTYSKVLDYAVQEATKAGLIFVVAAGNDRHDACDSSSNLKDAITVGAVAPLDTQTVFTNYGKCVNIFAPGHDLISSFIDDYAEDSFSSSTGTSMAAALVAGAIAKELEPLVKDKQSHIGARDIVLQSATKDNIKLLRKSPGSPNKMLFTSCDATGEEAASALGSDKQRIRKVARSAGVGTADCVAMFMVLVLVVSSAMYNLDFSHMM